MDGRSFFVFDNDEEKTTTTSLDASLVTPPSGSLAIIRVNITSGNPFEITPIFWNLLSFLSVTEKACFNLVRKLFRVNITNYHNKMQKIAEQQTIRTIRAAKRIEGIKEEAERRERIIQQRLDAELAQRIKEAEERTEREKKEKIALLHAETKIAREEEAIRNAEEEEEWRRKNIRLYQDNLIRRITLLENFIEEIEEEKQNRSFFSGRWKNFTPEEVVAYRQDFNSNHGCECVGWTIIGGFVLCMIIETAAENAFESALAHGVGWASAQAAYSAMWSSFFSPFFLIPAIILLGLLISWCVRELTNRLDLQGPERFDAHKLGFFSKEVLKKAKEIGDECGKYDTHLSLELALGTIETKTIRETMTVVSNEKQRLCEERNRLFPMKQGDVQSITAEAKGDSFSLVLYS
ncbi:MAG: hypothetical protein K0R24_188 [Gammaproteobacteria bacterium]|jgi:hypothetical protein|nr:hypothetical protein [Gammaproteobacteria bacterium]